MALANKEEITLGSGDLYLVEFTDVIPDDATIEVEANRIGELSDDTTLEYSCEWKEVQNSKGKVVKSFPIKEEVKLTADILSWNTKTIDKMVQTGKVTEDEVNGIRTIEIGGIKNYINKYYFVHFVHTKDDGKKIRITLKGKNQNGLSLVFGAEATTIGCEFKAFSMNTEDRLVKISEEVVGA
ncbi:hypothetical protein [Cellulosilyticum sp. I15G10I2]|uniref:hypothetical protein n=1 Tax=Cellulosilyticum sp. I15G10I2 TaxID=1892843 RepID=UPI00085C3EA5|nr:hypothetical protein [Cellulosilyticum sp. I15G10I2]